MAAEQELTSDNPAAVARLQGIHEMEHEWLSGYVEPATALREEVELGHDAQLAFAELSARTVGKEKFDAIRMLLEKITGKFEGADDVEGRFLMESITLDLVNMETGQRGFLLSGQDASLDPYNNGQAKLTSDIQMLRELDHAAASVTDDDIDGTQLAVTVWKEAAAQPEIDARVEVRSFPKDMNDIQAWVNSGLGKESMDQILAELAEFYDDETALNVMRADEVEAAAASERTIGIGISSGFHHHHDDYRVFPVRSIVSGVNIVADVLSKLPWGTLPPRRISSPRTKSVTCRALTRICASTLLRHLESPNGLATAT